MNLYENLTDEDLDNLHVEVLIEQERRQARGQIPAKIADLTQRYIDAGGDPKDLPFLAPGDGPVIVE